MAAPRSRRDAGRWLPDLPAGPRRLYVCQQPCANAVFGEHVPWVSQRAAFQGQTAAADTIAEMIAQPFQVGDARIQVLAPLLRHASPILGCRRTVVRER